jgi:hypothetical protein
VKPAASSATPSPAFRTIRISALVALIVGSFVSHLHAQSSASPSVIPVPAASTAASPIAIVALDSRIPGSAAVVTGALQVMGGKAIIAANGTVTAGATTTDVFLPQRGTLHVCASTTVKLAADSSVPPGEAPGVMMAMEHGAVEANFATGHNADIVLTPDFRILIGGPGMDNVKVRLGDGGDTCVDNPAGNAPYVLVTSVFDGSVYRVQPGQRVMFQHGNLHEVVDQEKEPCGCPPAPAQVQGNDFPLARSEGLAPIAAGSPGSTHDGKAVPAVQPLTYNAGDVAAAAGTPAAQSPNAEGAPPPKPAHHKKNGLFERIGHFFRRIFGAE